LGEVVPFPRLTGEERELIRTLEQRIAQGVVLGPKEQKQLLELMAREERNAPDRMDADSRQRLEDLKAHIARGDYLTGPRQALLLMLKHQQDRK
jgi:hypothetical protein